MKEEKETLFNKLKFDLETLKNENENLKEINIKYDRSSTVSRLIDRQMDTSAR